MNNIAFLQKVSESFNLKEENPIEIYRENEKVILKIMGKTWMADSLDQSITALKQSFAINYLEYIETIMK